MNTSCKRVFDAPDLHKIILSYVLNPLIMTTLCPVAQNWGVCFDKASWMDNVVDVPPWYKPAGLVAWNHVQSWTFAKYVVTRPWMFRSVGLLMNSSVQPWQWLGLRPALHDIPVLSPNCNVLDLKDTMWRCFLGKCYCIGSPAPFCDIRVRLHVHEEPVHDLYFGFTNTKDACEILALMTNQYFACGLLEREFALMDLNQLKCYYCVIRGDVVSLYLNARLLHEASCPRIQCSAVIKIGVVESNLVFGFYDWFIETCLPTDGVCTEDYYFPFLVFDGGKWTQDPLRFPVADPLLSRKDATKD